MNRHRTPAQIEAAIQHRLLRGRMPYARDAEGQPPERIQAWQEHCKNWVAPPKVERQAEQVWLQDGGREYRVSGSPSVAAATYPEVEVYMPEKVVTRRGGRRQVQTGHWRPVQHGGRRQRLIEMALALGEAVS